LDALSRKRSTIVDVLSVLALYGILFIAILIFTTGLASNMVPGASVPFGTSTVILVALSAALVALIGYFIARTARSRGVKGPGGKFRLRLVGYFIAVAVLASLPQALVFWNALNDATGTWFNARIEKAVRGGERLALGYAELVRADARSIAETLVPVAAPPYAPDGAEGLLETLRDADGRIASVQILPVGYGRGTEESSSAGEALFWETASTMAAYGEGELPSRDTQAGYAIRYLKEIRSGGRRYAVILGMRFPDSWTGDSEAIHGAAREAAAISAAMPRYRGILALLYILLASPLLLASVLFALVASDLAARPLAAIERATGRVAAGDLGTRLLSRPQDDFSDLMTSFNRMVADLEHSRSAIVQAGKVSAWQDIAQKLAHELKNPLTPIRLSAERVLKRYRADPATAVEILEPAMLSIIQEVDGLSGLLEEFRDFARLPEPQFEWTDIGGVASEVARSFSASHPGVLFDISGIAAGMLIRADRGHIRQLFLNLFLNAIDAMNGEGLVAVKSDLVKRSDSRYCRIQISDTGPGITADLRDKLFTPYFTTKEKGTGLGLSIVEHIVIDHKGEVWFESEEGSGATFFIDLPVDDSIEGAAR
jgi:two-component system, NtrC family, nitrogen regulation sensor histidine kinase NtrY